MTQLLNNSELWLGLIKTHINKIQEFQYIFLRRVFQVSPSGTPKGMLELDGQMISMNWMIVESRLRALGKTTRKDYNNICRKPGRNTCSRVDLLTECIYMCKELKVSWETRKKGEMRSAVWREEEEQSGKYKIPETKKESNYLKRMNLPNARIWFRF